MAEYKLLFKRSVAKDLRMIPKKDLKRTLERIEALANQPRPAGCEKLSGREYYRIRQGPYRIVYSVNDDEVFVLIIRVAQRSQAYRR